jgi:hypothetical protein
VGKLNVCILQKDAPQAYWHRPCAWRNGRMATHRPSRAELYAEADVTYQYPE